MLGISVSYCYNSLSDGFKEDRYVWNYSFSYEIDAKHRLWNCLEEFSTIELNCLIQQELFFSSLFFIDFYFINPTLLVSFRNLLSIVQRSKNRFVVDTTIFSATQNTFKSLNILGKRLIINMIVWNADAHVSSS